MVAIFTGAGFGFGRGSGSVLGDVGLLGGAVQGRSGDAISVNAATGNLLIQKQDEFLIGRGPDASVGRTYNSLTTLGDDNNDKWRQSTDRRVYGLTGTLNSAGSTVKRVSGDGTEVIYTWDATRSAYVTKDGGGAYDTIVKSGTEWVWTDGDSRAVERYFDDTAGKIKSVADNVGTVMSFTYDGSGRLSLVTTNDGSWIRYDWSGSTNNISQIVTGYTDLATSTSKTLTRTRYGYDASNRLTTVTVDLTPGDNSIADGQTYVTTYGYDASNRVNSITQSDGSALTITYDGSGRVSTLVQTVASGVTRTTTLNYYAGYSTVTSPDGQVTRLDYDASGNLTKITAPPAYSGATAQVWQFAYNANGDVTSTTDPQSQVTSFSNFTTNGIAQTITDRAGNATTRTFDAANHVLSETYNGVDATGASVVQTLRYVYNSAGDLRFAISAEGSVTEYVRNAYGAVTAEIQYVEAAYTTAGTPTEATMTTWTAGIADKSWVQRVDYQFDARLGLAKSTSYGIASSAGAGQTTQGIGEVNYVYDQAGQLLSSYATGQGQTSYAYDGMGRLTASTNAAGNTTSIVFNDASTTTTITNSGGRTIIETYNKAGDLIQHYDGGTNVMGGGTTAVYAVDKLGRTRVTTFTGTTDKIYDLYDAAGRHVATIDGSGRITEYRYDANNRLVGTIAYRNTVSSSYFATLDNPDNTLSIATIRPAAHAEDVESWTIYDAEGRVLQTIAGDGSTVISTYDAAGRLQKSTSYVNKVAAATVAGFIAAAPTAVITPATNASDVTKRYFYDKDGRLLGTIDGEKYVVRNSYDQAGQLVATTAFANATTAASPTTASFNTIIAGVATSAQDRTTRYVYDGRGELRYTVDALGNAVRYDYDAAGLKTRTVAYATALGTLSDYTFDYILAQLATQESATAKRVSYAVYDTAGRLAYSLDQTGATSTSTDTAVTAYVYDAVGNVIRTIAYATARATSSLPTKATMDSWAASAGNAADRVTRMWYTGRGELAWRVDAEGYVSKLTYDIKGRVTVETVWENAITVSDSTTFAQVAAAATGTSYSNNRTYDALDRVVRQYDFSGSNYTEYSYLGATKLVSTVKRAAGGTAQEQSTLTNVYDGAGRVITSTDATGTTEAAVSSFNYDGRGVMISMVDPRSKATSYTYDLDGRVKTMTDAANGVTTYDYNAFGEVWKLTDARGNASYSWYDKAGRVTTTRDAENYLTTTSYTVFGEIASVKRWATAATGTPAIGTEPTGSGTVATTQFTYDKAGRVLTSVNALSQTESYAYNNFGDRISVTNRASTVTSYTVDRLGRVTRESVNAATANINAAGTVTTGAHNVKTYSYDSRGNVKTLVEGFSTTAGGAVTALRTTSYSYDALGQLTTVTYDGVTVIADDMVTTSTATPTEQFTYDKRGNVIKSVDKAGAQTFSFYDDLDRKIAEIRQLSATQAAYTSYAYDGNGNLVTTKVYEGNPALPSSPGGTPPAVPSGLYRQTDFAYDNLNRMTTSTVVSNTGNLIVSGTGGESYIRQDVSATAAGQVISLYSDGTRWQDVTGGSRLSVEIGVEATGIVSATHLAVHFFDANGNYVSGTTISGVYGNQPFNTRMGGFVTVPVNATMMRVEVYAYTSGGGSGSFSVTQPMVALATAGQADLPRFHNELPNLLNDPDISGTSGWSPGYNPDSIATGSIIAGRHGWTSMAGNLVTQYEYDANGNLLKIKDPSGATTWNWYDKLDRKIAYVDSKSYLTSYILDAEGNVLRETRYATPIASAITAGGNPPAINLIPNSDFSLGPAGWTIGYDPNNILKAGSPYTLTNVNGGGTNAIKAEFNATAAGQVVSLTTATNVPVVTGDYLAVQMGIEGQGTGIIGSQMMAVYFYDASGNVIPNTGGGIASASGPQGYNTKISGFVDVPQGAVSMRLELYMTSAGAGQGTFVITQPIVASTPRSQTQIPAYCSNAGGLAGLSNARTKIYTYDLNGNRLTEKRTGVAAWIVSASTGALSAAGTDTIISYAYNALGQVTTKTVADALIATYVYDDTGRLTSEQKAAYTDANGVSVTPTTNYEYDAIGDLSRTTQLGATGTYAAADRVTTYRYAEGGRLVGMVDAEGFAHNYYYDVAGRLKKDAYSRVVNTNNTISSNATTTVAEAQTSTYDLAGRVLSQAIYSTVGGTFKRIGLTSFQYNNFGQVTQQGTGTNSATDISAGTALYQVTNQYDAAGRLVGTNGGDGVWKFFGYDKVGNQTVAVTSAGATFTSGTGLATALSQVGNANVNGTYTLYDARNQATQVVEEGRDLSATVTNQTLTTSRSYNAFGEVATETDARGYSITYTYNTMGRMVRSESPGVQITNENGGTNWVKPSEDYYYDLGGRLIAMRDANGTYGAGTSGAPASKAANTGNLTTYALLAGMGYDGSESVIATEFHSDGGKKQTLHDRMGDARVIRDELYSAGTPNLRVTEQTFNKLGHLTQVKHNRLTNVADDSTRLVDNYAYDQFGQRIQHWNSQYGAAVIEKSGYDGLGRITTQVDMSGYVTSTAYAWDGTLVTSAFGTFGGWVETTTYANNRTAISKADIFDHEVFRQDLGGHQSAATFDAGGRQLTSGGISYSWYNTGLLATSAAVTGTMGTNDWSRNLTTYGYDKTGNRTSEKLINDGSYTVYSWYYSYPVAFNYQYVDETATYDALGRRLTMSEAGSSYTPAASITNTYDAAGNVRSTSSTHAVLNLNGAVASTTTDTYWYRYDSMNRLVTDRGMLSGAAGAAGTTIMRAYTISSSSTAPSNEYAYDLTGQRIAAIRTDYLPGGWDWSWTYYSPGYYQETRENYDYDGAGRIAAIRTTQGAAAYEDYLGPPPSSIPTAPTSGGFTNSTFGYDAMGRQTSQSDYQSGVTGAVYSRTATYAANGAQFSDNVSTKRNDNDTYLTNSSYTFTASGTGEYLLGAVGTVTTYNYTNGSYQNTSSTVNTYQWWDSAVQGTIAYKPNTSSSTTYTTTFYYDGQGVLTSAYIGDGRPRSVTFRTNGEGQVIRRDEADNNYNATTGGDPHEIWYRFGGVEMGYVGNNGTSRTSTMTSIADRRVVPGTGAFRNGSSYMSTYNDFAQSSNPVNSYAQGSAAGGYTVQRAGETLRSVAQQLWGDSSLWYKLAEANGIQGDMALAEGQRLNVPAGVSRTHHNASTFRPYDANEATGNVSPTTPKPAKKNKCGVFGQILLAVVAIAVTAIALPAGGLAAGWAGVGQGALAGLAGGAASQAVGVATGIQSKFDFKGLALSAIGGGVSAGVGQIVGQGAVAGSQIVGDVARGVASSALTQGIGVATGLQSKFSWASVAAAGVMAGIGGIVAREFQPGSYADGKTPVPNGKGGTYIPSKGSWVPTSGVSFGGQVLAGAASVMAGAATRSAITGTGFGDNVAALLPEAIGNTVGNLVADQVASVGRKEHTNRLLAELAPDGASKELRTQIRKMISAGIKVGADDELIRSEVPNLIEQVTGVADKPVSVTEADFDTHAADTGNAHLGTPLPVGERDYSGPPQTDVQKLGGLNRYLQYYNGLISSQEGPDLHLGPILIQGGSLAERYKTYFWTIDVLRSPRGQDFQTEAMKTGRWERIIIDNNYSDYNGNHQFGIAVINSVNINEVKLPTSAGYIGGDPEAIIAHELGHSIMGYLDDGPRDMNNVRANENPVRSFLHRPLRTSYGSEK